MPRIHALPPNTEGLAASDELAMHNESTGDTEKVTVQQIVDHISWVDAEESWAYSSWTAATRVGVITVPTDATVKYSEGMRVRFSQTTGGVKYGIIIDVSSTTLTVFFPTGTTFTNETIASPYYSSMKVPVGFDADASLWTLSVTYTGGSAVTQSSPVTGTWYNLNGCTLTVPKGSWLIGYQAGYSFDKTATAVNAYITLSTANNTESDSEVSAYAQINAGSAGLSVESTARVSKNYRLAASTQYFLNEKTETGGGGTLRLNIQKVPTIIFATCAYL